MGESAGNEMTMCSGSEEKVRLPIRRLTNEIMFSFLKIFFWSLETFFGVREIQKSRHTQSTNDGL